MLQWCEQCYNGMYCVQHVSSTGAETEGLRSPGLISSHPISDKGPHLTISDKGPAHHLRQGTEMLSSEHLKSFHRTARISLTNWFTSDEIFTVTIDDHLTEDHLTPQHHSYHDQLVISWMHCLQHICPFLGGDLGACKVIRNCKEERCLTNTGGNVTILQLSVQMNETHASNITDAV